MALALNLHGYISARGVVSQRDDITTTYNKPNHEKILKFVDMIRQIPFVYLANHENSAALATGSLGNIQIWFETDLYNRPMLKEMISVVVKSQHSRSTIISPSFDHFIEEEIKPTLGHVNVIEQITKKPIGIILLDNEYIDDFMKFTPDTYDPDDVTTLVDASVSGRERLKSYIRGWKSAGRKVADKKGTLL